MNISIDRIGMLAIAFEVSRSAVGCVILRLHWVDRLIEVPQLMVLYGLRYVWPTFRHRGVAGLVNRVVSDAMREEIAGSDVRQASLSTDAVSTRVARLGGVIRRRYLRGGWLWERSANRTSILRRSSASVQGCSSPI
jgi:hypothetical protein